MIDLYDIDCDRVKAGGRIWDADGQLKDTAKSLVWFLKMLGWGPLPDSVLKIRFQLFRFLSRVRRGEIDDETIDFFVDCTDEEIMSLFSIASFEKMKDTTQRQDTEA